MALLIDVNVPTPPLFYYLLSMECCVHACFSYGLMTFIWKSIKYDLLLISMHVAFSILNLFYYIMVGRTSGSSKQDYALESLGFFCFSVEFSPLQ